MLVLKLKDGNGKSKIIELADRGVFAVGKNNCPIIVEDHTVSFRHAQFICDGEYWFVEDLKSTNGTFVNDKRIKTKMALGRGDVIRMGNAVFRVGRTTSKSGEPVPVDASEIDIEDRLKLSLLVIAGEQQGETFDVSYDHPAPIGRASKVVKLDDPKSSRRHAALIPKAGKWYIRDMASPNGTFVNGKGITTTTELDEGDLIEIGNTQIQVTHIPDEEMVALRVEVEQVPVASKNRSDETFVADFEDSYEGDLPSAEDTQLGTVDFDDEFPDPFADFRAKIALKNDEDSGDADEGMLPAVGQELLKEWLDAPELDELDGRNDQEELEDPDDDEEFEDPEQEEEAPLRLKDELLHNAIPIPIDEDEDEDEEEIKEDNPDALETMDSDNFLQDDVIKLQEMSDDDLEETLLDDEDSPAQEEKFQEEVSEPVDQTPLELATVPVAEPTNEPARKAPADLAFEGAPDPPPPPVPAPAPVLPVPPAPPAPPVPQKAETPKPPVEPIVQEPVNKVLAKRQELLADFIGRSMHRLSKNDVAVWLALFHESNNEFKASTGQTKLSKHVGASPSTVGGSIQRLEEAGLITVLYQGGLGRGTSRYQVHGKKSVTLIAKTKAKTRTKS
jgi:pSer/pThr/pTyr-binding forkhead associated (FHA) protein/predicted transcriptional regulator